MINPTEFNTTLINIRISLVNHVNKYLNLHDYGIQGHKDKLKLVIVNQYYKYLTKVLINPIDPNNKILVNPGQLYEPNSNNEFYSTKSYDEAKILKCIKRLNQILKTGYTLKVYPDVFTLKP